MMACFLFFWLTVGIGSSLVFLVRSLVQDMFDVFPNDKYRITYYAYDELQRSAAFVSGCRWEPSSSGGARQG